MGSAAKILPRKSPSFSLLADRCTSMKQLKQIHAQMIISSRIHDNYAASRIMNFCALSSSGDLNYALKLFDATQEPNSFMWNTLIRAFAISPAPSNAILLYKNMRQRAILPGKHTFPFLLKACTNDSSLFSGKQIHTHVFKLGTSSDLYVINGLIRLYTCSGSLNDARQLFDDMAERNLIVWTTMISGYAQNFCSNEALEFFYRMVADGFVPNDVTLASVLSACARAGDLALGRQIHQLIRDKGVELGVILGTALVDMYAKNGAIFDARKLFDEMPERNIATWNAMISGLAMHGHATGSLELYRELQKGSIEPNDITFVGVLSACCHAGLLEAGCNIFDSMIKKYGIKPKIEHYGCMVDLLGRGGRLAEAEELIRSMEMRVDVVVLGALLGACRTHGNIEIAERVVKEILVLEPQNHSVYVVLSNMYAEAGRWEDVVRFRKMMRDGGLIKTPGCSFVDGDKQCLYLS